MRLNATFLSFQNNSILLIYMLLNKPIKNSFSYIIVNYIILITVDLYSLSNSLFRKYDILLCNIFTGV